eukprot:gene28199-31295_t
MALPPGEDGGMDEFKEAYVLTNTEMSILLNLTTAKKREKNPHFELDNVMKKTKEYVDKFGQGRNEESMREIRRILLENGFKEFEIGIIANVMPESVEEATVILPSLKDPSRFPNEDHIQDVLSNIMRYRAFQ